MCRLPSRCQSWQVASLGESPQLTQSRYPGQVKINRSRRVFKSTVTRLHGHSVDLFYSRKTSSSP
jgi:hypothetical protein